jgi:hypothetical protein
MCRVERVAFYVERCPAPAEYGVDELERGVAGTIVRVRFVTAAAGDDAATAQDPGRSWTVRTA